GEIGAEESEEEEEQQEENPSVVEGVLAAETPGLYVLAPPVKESAPPVKEPAPPVKEPVRGRASRKPAVVVDAAPETGDVAEEETSLEEGENGATVEAEGRARPPRRRRRRRSSASSRRAGDGVGTDGAEGKAEEGNMESAPDAVPEKQAEIPPPPWDV
ncbi:MAG: hypothetical protein HQL95_14675, partial [Magnetococcales bacterium]|nr:hypothetical protein [Magnetococcales bacterium]